MKVQDLRGLVFGDSFKVAGVTLTVTGPNICTRGDSGKRYFWGIGDGSGATDLHDMEVTDVVRRRERVILTFEVLRDDDVIKDFDVGDTSYRLHDLRESGEIGCTAKKACAHGGFSRILRPVKT